jgi:hypothetical protein
MYKFALLIGINYIQIPILTLQGCIDDIELVNQKLQSQYGYDPENIVMLRDDRGEPPTRAAILGKLCELAAKSESATEIWIHYSGHGSRARAFSGTEEEDVLVPIDYMTQGFLTDTDLAGILVNMKCRILCFVDACHSGTVGELPYTYSYNLFDNEIRHIITIHSDPSRNAYKNPAVFLISGCADDERSADSYSERYREPMGAFTNALLESMPVATSIQDLYKKTCRYLAEHGFSQTPLLSCSQMGADYSFRIHRIA